MAELRNCPKCNEFFNYTGVRDICAKCARAEEEMYEVVYRFLRKRENRAATVERIVEATSVEADLLHKWVRKGRLQPTLFPNLGYPCDQCGKLTVSGKLCETCLKSFETDLRTFDAAQEFRENIRKQDRATYLAEKKFR